MISTKKLIFLGFSVLLFISCSNDDDITLKPVSSSINKIMPLGASRVEGDRPNFESFRYQLWKNLISNERTFDFIGTQTDEASYPTFSNTNFDIDHEGWSGWTSGQILSELDNWLIETGSPDIVLFSSPGGNDGLDGLDYAQTISNINAIIDVLQANNANVTIIIEQMAPGHSSIMTNELSDFFNQLQQEVAEIATNQTTANSQVIAIDMFTGFSDNLLADDVHYNEAGASFIATRYYDVLETVLE